MAHPVGEAALVSSVAGGMALAGEFVDAGGQPHLMVVNRDYDNKVSLSVTLREAPDSISRLSRQTGVWEATSTGDPVTPYDPATGELQVRLAAGDAELFRLNAR